MELVLDIGNSTVTSAFFKDDEVIDISTIAHNNNTAEVPYKFVRTIDLILGYNIEKVIVASVVPELTELFCKNITSNTAVKPFIITHDSYSGLKSKYKDISQLGIDRLCNIAYAVNRYKKSVVIIDIGSALTIEIIDSSGYFKGGMILPGITLSSKALNSNTALLPAIKNKEIDYFIGRNTIECISSGIINGLAVVCDGFVEKIEKELNTKMKIILTGGDASLIGKRITQKHEIIKNTVLLGAKIIYSKQI